MKKQFLLLFSLFFLSIPGICQTSTLKQKLQTQFEDRAAPGLLIGYADQHDAFTLAFGLADSVKNEALTIDHLMMSGSTGKIVVAAAVLKLVSENKLQLDDPIQKYLDESWKQYIPNFECLTVRNLLQHRTGIARYVFSDFKEKVKQKPDHQWTPQERLAFIAKQAPQFACNADFAYSDTNYIILGMLIEKISGMEFYTYAEKHIFKPLEIDPFIPTNSRQIELLANGYATEKDPLGFTGAALDQNGKSRYNLQFEWTGGGYAYNPKQMAQLMMAIFEGKVFGKTLLEAYTATLPAPEIHAEYGLGLIKYEMNGKTLYGHSGFFPGYIAMVYYDPDKKCSYVFQINSTNKESIQLLSKGIQDFFKQKS